MNKKLDRVKLSGEKRGYTWAGYEATKEFYDIFFVGRVPQKYHCYHVWDNLRAALETICKDGDFQGQCTINDVWGEAIYIDGRSTISIPLEINVKTLIRWGFMEE